MLTIGGHATQTNCRPRSGFFAILHTWGQKQHLASSTYTEWFPGGDSRPDQKWEGLQSGFFSPVARAQPVCTAASFSGKVAEG